MKKIVLLTLIVIFNFANNAMAILPTREYTPVVKQSSFVDEVDVANQSHVWEIRELDKSNYDCIVCNGFIVSSLEAQDITLVASDVIVTLHIQASSTVVSPSGFLWKGTVGEVINIYTSASGCSVTLTGWEEN